MTNDPAGSAPYRRERVRAQVRAFIAELVAAGIRPTGHRLGAGPQASITVVGWGIGGCRGLLRGCGPDCELVVTTNANLVLMCHQPRRARWTLTRPRYVDLAAFENLPGVLATGRAVLLPRSHAA